MTGCDILWKAFNVFVLLLVFPITSIPWTVAETQVSYDISPIAMSVYICLLASTEWIGDFFYALYAMWFWYGISYYGNSIVVRKV